MLFEGLDRDKINGRRGRHPLELFDFVFGTYVRSSRENLSEWLSDHYPLSYLQQLSQLELAEIYSAGIAATMWREFETARAR